MSTTEDRPDFSTIADLFLSHGSMQSPAFLDGRLCAERRVLPVELLRLGVHCHGVPPAVAFRP